MVDLISIDMDEFDLILGQEFLRMVSAAVVSHLNSLVLDLARLCLIPAVKSKDEERGLNALSANQICKSNWDDLYLATFLRAWDEGESSSTFDTAIVQDVLLEYTDIMLESLPSVLPP